VRGDVHVNVVPVTSWERRFDAPDVVPMISRKLDSLLAQENVTVLLSALIRWLVTRNVVGGRSCALVPVLGVGSNGNAPVEPQPAVQPAASNSTRHVRSRRTHLIIALMKRLLSIFVLVGLAAAPDLRADKVLFTKAFTPAEFAARRAKVMSAIGDGVAVISGATETSTYTKFRQGAQFFYLCGVEVPRAILVIDGRSKTSTLFLPAHDRLEQGEGPRLGPDEEARMVTGVDRVADRTLFGEMVNGFAGRTLYLPHREESLGAGTPDRIRSHATATANDPWDQRASKEIVFRDKVGAAAKGSTSKDLDPILDAMRMIKSPAEIEILREGTRIAGLGILEAMKNSRAGAREYELEAAADYIFKKNNAQGIAYFALVATGTNSFWSHYHQAQDTLKNGDLVLMDYAPDYMYYNTDVTRMFPANGTFTARQRELYGIYADLYTALLSSIRPGPASEGLAEAHKKMHAIMSTFKFSDPAIKAAATRFVEGYARARNSYGHMIGMEVHDVSVGFDGIYKPGMAFTIEPALTIPEERIYVRLEDPIVITATGIDHLSKSLPYDIASIERLMKKK
jgi:Xaa-Pro aminopeptidase